MYEPMLAVIFGFNVNSLRNVRAFPSIDHVGRRLGCGWYLRYAAGPPQHNYDEGQGEGVRRYTTEHF
jgi:hypothetical protein